MPFDTPLFADVNDYHLTFRLCEHHHRAIFSDSLALHILELTKFQKSAEHLVTPLDRCLYFLRYARELDVADLPEPLDVADVRWALGDLIMISQSDLERERYESRLKFQRDNQAHLDDAWENGVAAGREEGRLEGLEQGRAEIQIVRIQFLQNILRHEATASEDLRTLSYADLESLATRQEAKLAAKVPKDA